MATLERVTAEMMRKGDVAVPGSLQMRGGAGGSPSERISRRGDCGRADFGDSQTEHEQDAVVPQSRWEASQKQQFTYDTTVRVSPERYRVAVGVTDLTSSESGFQTFTVDAK